MKNQFKKFLCILFVATMMLSMAVQAAPKTGNEKEKGGTGIVSTKSNGINASEDDIFEIHYTDNVNSGSFQYSLTTGREIYLHIDPGLYYINGIDYLGSNENIKSLGFAISTEFKATEEYSGLIHIAVGTAAIKKLYATNTGIIVKYNGEYVNVERHGIGIIESKGESTATEETEKKAETTLTSGSKTEESADSGTAALDTVQDRIPEETAPITSVSGSEKDKKKETKKEKKALPLGIRIGVMVAFVLMVLGSFLLKQYFKPDTAVFKEKDHYDYEDYDDETDE